MSGVAGADRVRSRQDFDHFIQDYKRLISLFPGFVSMTPSGSYNSNPDKQDFGDIDLIVHISSNLSKADVKKQLQAFFMKEPETKIVPFSSEKHAGKRTYNAGELVSVRYHDDALGYSAQIDNIIALDHNEAGFKQQFLDWPAEKQGLILGLVKVATIETDPSKIFRSLGIQVNTNIEANQEYEFNLSSVRIELRLSTYDPELLKQKTYKTIKSEVVWQSQNFDDLKKILWQYDLDDDFAGLVAQTKKIIKNDRSPQRIKGVFASMITVKSGEVGTAKGAGKEAALAKINQTFSETRSLFRALVEADDQRRVVFAFVRFQPPTVGHELLITTVKETAEENHCPYAIYVSRTQDHKKNPLSIEQKMQYLNKLFPGTNFVAAGATTRTPIEAAKALNGKFNDLILVAGSDRANLRDTLEAYNHKEYEYNSINFVSAGERDPDADDVTGVSGTNVRQMALDGDYESFKSNLPGSADDATAEQLMRDIQAGMTKPARAKKTGENRDLQGTDVTWKRGMSGTAYPQTYHNTGHTGGVAEGSEQSLSSMVNQDQSERNEYKNFVKSQAGGDWSKGAKMYAQIKKRPSNDIFGDASRLNQFMKMKFDFDKFTDEDWDNYWLLAQHCDDNRNFQKNALSIIKKYQGTDHSHYKYLYDRISMGLTGKQKYGTQNTIKQGVAEGFSNDMSTEDMIAYLRQHHDTNLHQDYLNHINTFSKFVLQNVPVNSIKTDLPKLDREKVEQYKQMDFSKAPPIVLGGGYILDGYHRANVAKALGLPTIKAYVGQQGVAEGSENNNTTAQKIFFARSNKAPKEWSYDHVGFITQDGKQIQMSGHKGNDVYVTNDVTDDPEFPKQNIKIVSLSKPVSVPTTNSVGAENCGTFVANVLQANGIKGIDTEKIYSVFKQPQNQGVAEGKMNQLSRDMVDLSGPEFSQEYGTPKSSFQAPIAVPKISPQFDLSRVPPGFPQPPWDLNTVKAYWRLKNIPGNPAAAWQRGYRGPIKKQIPIGEELESIMAGLISIIESKHGRA